MKMILVLVLVAVAAAYPSMVEEREYPDLVEERTYHYLCRVLLNPICSKENRGFEKREHLGLNMEESRRGDFNIHFSAWKSNFDLTLHNK